MAESEKIELETLRAFQGITQAINGNVAALLNVIKNMEKAMEEKKEPAKEAKK